jgi:hypothetical protein
MPCPEDKMAPRKIWGHIIKSKVVLQFTDVNDSHHFYLPGKLLAAQGKGYKIKTEPHSPRDWQIWWPNSCLFYTHSQKDIAFPDGVQTETCGKLDLEGSQTEEWHQAEHQNLPMRIHPTLCRQLQSKIYVGDVLRAEQIS